MWLLASQITSSPGWVCTMMAIWFAWVPLGTNSAASLRGKRGKALLQTVDGGVVAEDVVAHLRARHGLAHGRGGTGDGVAAQIDGVSHGRRR